MEFHDKLRELRKRKGLTQEEVAQRLFVSRTAVSKWESGRGYPAIESLKSIAKIYSVTVDDLLSGEELLTIAQEQKRHHERSVRDLVFVLLDMSMSLLLILPFFADRIDEAVQAVSLLGLSHAAVYIRAACGCFVAFAVLLGILTLSLRKCTSLFWIRYKSLISLGLHAAGILLFVLCLQPYAAVWLFVFFLIKLMLLLKRE